MQALNHTNRMRLIQHHHRVRMVKGYVEIAGLCSWLERPLDATFFRLTATEILERVEENEDIIEYLYMRKELFR